MTYRNRVETIKAATAAEAKRMAPWAIIAANRPQGYVCFADRGDFIDWRLHVDA